MRIDKFLSLKNICTRSESQKFLRTNNVYYKNTKILDKKLKINFNTPLTINGVDFYYRKNIYFIINKPQNYICSSIDELYPSVLNLLSETDFQNDLLCVGRLDVDTTGILLITNDGNFAHNQLSPKKHVKKTYLVTCKNVITTLMIEKLTTGVIINSDYLTKEAHIEQLSPTQILLSITEGKYHQVKLMLLAVENEVIGLHRISFGEFSLTQTLNFGEYEQVFPFQN